MTEHPVYRLWENGTPDFDPSIGQIEPNLTWFPAEGKEPRGCVIVIPGGGYAMKASDHEGVQIAQMLNQSGIHAFVLDYRVTPYHHPVELGDGLRAVRYVRHYAEKFGVRKDKIAVLGFSAGGHLTISIAEHFDLGRDDGDEIDKESSRPDGAVFCYAVSSFTKEWTHTGSRENLLGTKEVGLLAHALDGAEAVRSDMPPCFLWHTFADQAVPVENTLELGFALRRAKVPTEIHIFPEGQHGLGLAPGVPHSAQWAPLLCNWLHHYDFGKAE